MQLQGRVEASTGAAVFLSTYSFRTIDAQNWSNTAFSSGCLTSSTVTVTVAGGMRVRVWLAGVDLSNTSAALHQFRVLEDGAALSVSVPSCRVTSVSDTFGCPGFAFERVPAGGQRTYCLQATTSAGTATLAAGHQFGAETVP